MGNKAAELEAECKTVLFAFEEAIGMKQATCTLVWGMYFLQPWIMGMKRAEIFLALSWESKNIEVILSTALQCLKIVWIFWFLTDLIRLIWMVL